MYQSLLLATDLWTGRMTSTGQALGTRCAVIMNFDMVLELALISCSKGSGYVWNFWAVADANKDSHDAGQLHRCCRCRRGHGPPAPTPPSNRRRLSSLSTPLTLLPPPRHRLLLLPARLPPTALRHLLFGIASSSKSLPRRLPYLRLWFHPSQINAIVFLDAPPPPLPLSPSDPPIAVSSDSSRFPYTFPGGLRSAIRVARIAKELVDRDLPDIRWIVLGDDDTIFFPQNLLATLRKYDWTKWYYVGARSESVGQNAKHWVYACLVELGVELTYEPGFHQVDLRGNLFGLLSAHPLTPLVSLHHVDNIDPIFPGMNRSEALKHLFEAVKVDSGRVLQQSICYDGSKERTISVSMGLCSSGF
ncbi:hypothetical protein J5N97_016798 [Dioscorea zingiberensis]|uniref:Fringe-like glycosyltransferase domain-containing protein n=1 Tax=Dioscorea zingiberensis TaxID=325984 RepID=A0A9D5CK51_9LILI|nr:hypothetical protein J5N97_016798 [Dioscorea zingiberensis]